MVADDILRSYAKHRSWTETALDLKAMIKRPVACPDVWRACANIAQHAGNEAIAEFEALYRKAMGAAPKPRQTQQSTNFGVKQASQMKKRMDRALSILPHLSATEWMPTSQAAYLSGIKPLSIYSLLRLLEHQNLVLRKDQGRIKEMSKRRVDYWRLPTKACHVKV